MFNIGNCKTVKLPYFWFVRWKTIRYLHNWLSFLALKNKLVLLDSDILLKVQSFCCMISLLLTKLVWSRWLVINLIFFLHFYGPRGSRYLDLTLGQYWISTILCTECVLQVNLKYNFNLNFLFQINRCKIKYQCWCEKPENFRSRHSQHSFRTCFTSEGNHRVRHM